MKFLSKNMLEFLLIASTWASIISATVSATEASQTCAPYRASNTNTGTQNTVACPLYVCPGTVLTLETCNGDGKSCTGDTYLRLIDGSGYELAANDDRCGLCSAITFHFRGNSCQEYTVDQGCYGDEACSGTVKIVHESGPALPPYPMGAPTAIPTAAFTTPPTVAPTILPTAAPTILPTAASSDVVDSCAGPFVGYDRCEHSILKLFGTKSQNWYSARGLDGSRCSLQKFLSSQAKGRKCPPVTNARSSRQQLRRREDDDDDEEEDYLYDDEYDE